MRLFLFCRYNFTSCLINIIMLLSELKLNEKGRITKINLLGRIKAKFGELGVVEGADVILLRKTLLGGTMEIVVQDYNLAIRKSQAEKIVVVKVDD